VKSTLIELPPEATLDEASDYFEAGTVQEIAVRENISDENILKRLLLPGDIFGSYKILGFISSGGMGEVYVAERILEDGNRFGPVALKVICDELANDWAIKARFKREAEISRAIRSPRVIRVYEIGETDSGIPFLAMELLEGEELFDRLCSRSSFTVEETAELFMQILDGISAVHKSGFIHRDIKPENIFLTLRSGGREIVKIIDFGIAKSCTEASDPYLSVVGQIYGTPEYLSPEQCLTPDVDHRADLYSIGVMMYECVTGSLPFTGETPYAVILAQQNSPPPPLPSSVDPAFASIIDKALLKEADDRYQSADEMLEELREWLRESAGGDDDYFLQRTSQEMAASDRKSVGERLEADSPDRDALPPKTQVSLEFEKLWPMADQRIGADGMNATPVPGAPREAEPARPAADEPARPAADEPARPAADEPARPAADEPARPAADDVSAPPTPVVLADVPSVDIEVSPPERPSGNSSEAKRADSITKFVWFLMMLALLWFIYDGCAANRNAPEEVWTQPDTAPPLSTTSP
jgi:serine/threonine protein kinase